MCIEFFMYWLNLGNTRLKFQIYRSEFYTHTSYFVKTPICLPWLGSFFLVVGSNDCMMCR